MEQSRFFHVCTDGTSNGIIFTCDADFQTAIKISAILAYKMGIRIICYCHMTNHSHFVVSCQSEAAAKNFIDSFKREYAFYMKRKYAMLKAFHEVRSYISEITDRYYLKNCISYVLLNPVAAKICRTPEEYGYSSFKAYFSDKPVIGVSPQELGMRKSRIIFRTKYDLSQSGYLVGNDGHMVLRSFVDYSFVESLFGTPTWFFKSLALTNSVDEELKYSPAIASYSDMEIYAEVSKISEQRFGNREYLLLSKSERLSLIPVVERKTHASPKRLSRILRLSPIDVMNVLGIRQ